jgi:hypothetical protein
VSENEYVEDVKTASDAQVLKTALLLIFWRQIAWGLFMAIFSLIFSLFMEGSRVGGARAAALTLFALFSGPGLINVIRTLVRYALHHHRKISDTLE